MLLCCVKTLFVTVHGLVVEHTAHMYLSTIGECQGNLGVRVATNYSTRVPGISRRVIARYERKALWKGQLLLCDVKRGPRGASRHYGRSRSMTMEIPSTPDCTGRLVPSKSPLCGIAWPDFDIRATITTGPALESFLDGMGLVESSS